ncbi:MAG: hypothetical protein OXI60_04770 [Acidiferrobacterales bacterium]|nr:hypothetical protein [Acidiferrobacterales bacterium]
MHRNATRQRSLALASVVTQVLVSPGSKLATARRLSTATAGGSLGAILDLDEVSGNHDTGVVTRLQMHWSSMTVSVPMYTA